MSRAVALLAASLLGVPLVAQQAEDPSPHSDARLVSELASIRPGEAFTVALHLTMDTGWHSYWRNPGDAGGETVIEWTLPDGFTAGAIQWPHPHRIEAPPLVSYGYDAEVLLLVEVVPSPQVQPGSSVTLEAHADWVVCEEICLPATADVSLALPVAEGAARLDPEWGPAVARTRARLPAALDAWAIEAWSVPDGFVLALTPPRGWEGAFQGSYFFSGASGVIAHAAPQALTRDGDSYQLSLAPSDYLQGSLARLEGVLLAPDGVTWDAERSARAMAVDVPVTERPMVAGAPLTLVTALLFAFVGGLLLNLMPCVFPVLSLKVLGFVSQGGAERSNVRAHGIAFAAGVIASFWFLAGLLLALRAGGTALGWGFQLQSPAFVAIMAALFFLLGLSLFGAFDVGTSLTRLGGVLGASEGYGSSLASGVLATVVATPCIAPLMGAALGFALTQPPLPTLLVFGTLGLGMAAPSLALSMAPALLQRLPRPGPWMVTLRQFLAFPLFATSVWLVWVFGRQTGLDGATALLAGLTLLGFTTWAWWRWRDVPRGSPRFVASRVAAAVALIAAVAVTVRGTAGEAPGAPDALWQPYSAAGVAELRAAGRPVFIDFTAAWCLTCKVNERVVLSTTEAREAFRERKVALIMADWTRRDPEITRALESFGRSGVPLYVLYPGGEQGGAMVLPVILTKQILFEALETIPSE
jgi:thiol:disulfide interchange protein DsbD